MIDLLNCDAAMLLDIVPDAGLLNCDPPYREHVHKNATSQSARGGARKRDLGFAHLTPELRATIAAGAAKARRWSLVYTDAESIGTWQAAGEDAGAEYIRAIPWVRWSMPNLTGTLPPQGWEAICVFHSRGRKHWNGSGNLLALEHLDGEEAYPEIGALRHKAERGEKKHKTAKPLDQALDLVSWFSDPEELVVDLTAGRGTTAVACALLGRDFVGAELNPEEAVLALERIEAAQRGQLSERDTERLLRWSESTLAEDTSTSTAPAQARAAARKEDVARALSIVR